jgi:hypothetical protein
MKLNSVDEFENLDEIPQEKIVLENAILKQTNVNQ